MIRLTVSMSYPSGSEVLLFDSGPLLTIATARTLAPEVESALENNANQITVGGGQLVVRIADRVFEEERARLTPKTKPRTPRFLAPGEF
jgi:hypothetical protein